MGGAWCTIAKPGITRVGATGEQGFGCGRLAANVFNHFRRTKCGLALVIFPEIKEAVACNATPGQAMEFRALEERMFARRLLGMAQKVMPR